jgi:predicted amidohydrolase YtcJ
MGALLSIKNARVWTGHTRRPWAASLTIADRRVAALDEADDGRVIDAEGRTVVPGLIDAHVHLLAGGESLVDLDLTAVTSRREFESAIARRHAELPPEAWLIGRGWSDENWPAEPRRIPDKSWLQPARPRPVVCYRMDMHAALVNDVVLGRFPGATDPPGGRIVRDPKTGEATGLLQETAVLEYVEPLIPRPDADSRRRSLLAAQARAHSLGLTAVGSMEYARSVAEVYTPLRERLTLRCRVTLLDRRLPLDFSFAESFAGDGHLGVIGFKTFVDGTMGSRTARMLSDYADVPGNRGMLVELAAEGRLREWVELVTAHGFSPSIHAIGDEALRIALDALDRADPACRARIEHAQQVHLDDLPRFRDRIASMQPLHRADDGRYLPRCLGGHRLNGAFAFRRLLDAGAKLAFGSDWPVVSLDPLAGIRAAVTGLTLAGDVFGADQNLTVDEALRAYTAGAAYALGLDDAGALRPGAVGDLVIFDRDPFEADWSQRPPQVVMTVAGGDVVHDAR